MSTISLHELNADTNWFLVGEHLLSASLSHRLTGDAGSFSSYVQKVSERTGRKLAMTWRIFAAYKFYQYLREHHIKSLPEVPDVKVSIDNLEILTKLERSMPSQEFLKLAHTVVCGKVSRNQLREIWSHYKKVLDGKTARGRGEDPVADLNDKEQFGHALEARVATQVPDMMKDFIGRSIVLRNFVISKSIIVDMVAVANKDNQLSLHAFEVKTRVRSGIDDIFQRYELYFDYMWCVVSEAINLEMIPDGVGIMLTDANKLTIIRQAPYHSNESMKNIALRTAVTALMDR